MSKRSWGVLAFHRLPSQFGPLRASKKEEWNPRAEGENRSDPPNSQPGFCPGNRVFDGKNPVSRAETGLTQGCRNMGMKHTLAHTDPPNWLLGGRIPSLDGVRAVAILLVLYSHAAIPGHSVHPLAAIK